MSVSGTVGGWRMVWFGMRCTYSMALALAATVGVAHAQDTHWLDVESRIQYGYFTEDQHALRGLVEPLTSNDAHDRLKSYYAGLLAYRQTQLAEAQANPGAPAAGAGNKLPTPPRKNDRSKNEARQMVERCVSSL